MQALGFAIIATLTFVALDILNGGEVGLAIAGGLGGLLLFGLLVGCR